MRQWLAAGTAVYLAGRVEAEATVGSEPDEVAVVVVLAIVLPITVRAEVVVAAGWEAAVAAARAAVGPTGNVGLHVGQAGVERSFSFLAGALLRVKQLVFDANHQDAAAEQAWKSHRSSIRGGVPLSF